MNCAVFASKADVGLRALHDRLSLDSSTVALLVEAALRCPEEELPESPPERVYARRAIRGQNLDRAGLSPQHQKIMSLLAEPRSLDGTG